MHKPAPLPEANEIPPAGLSALVHTISVPYLFHAYCQSKLGGRRSRKASGAFPWRSIYIAQIAYTARVSALGWLGELGTMDQRIQRKYRALFRLNCFCNLQSFSDVLKYKPSGSSKSSLAS
jgi:hypothetical protein